MWRPVPGLTQSRLQRPAAGDQPAERGPQAGPGAVPTPLAGRRARLEAALTGPAERGPQAGPGAVPTPLADRRARLEAALTGPAASRHSVDDASLYLYRRTAAPFEQRQMRLQDMVFHPVRKGMTLAVTTACQSRSDRTLTASLWGAVIVFDDEITDYMCDFFARSNRIVLEVCCFCCRF